MMLFVTALLTALFALSSGQCVYDPEACTCSKGQGGNVCLRYSSSDTGNYQCEAYSCGSGYICDCGGSEMCSVTDCSATKDVFRPIGLSPSVGSIVACEKVASATCVHKITPTPAPLGAECNPVAGCTAGSICNCQGICTKEVSLVVLAYGDGSVQPFLCGNELGPGTTSYNELGSWSFTGACSDLYFFVTNSYLNTGMMAAVRESSSTSWYTTQVGGSSLTGLYKNNAANTNFMSDSDYNFGGWSGVVEQPSQGTISEYVGFRADFGARMWTTTEALQAEADTGTWSGNTWYKVTLPFC